MSATGNGYTLADYATDSGLSRDFLAKIGVREATYRGQRLITVGYPAAGGRSPAVRCIDSPRTPGAWVRPSKLPLYILSAASGPPDRMFVLDGELDAQSLAFHDLAAVAIPPAEHRAPEWLNALAKAVGDAAVFLVLRCTAEDLEVPDWVAHASFRDQLQLVCFGADVSVNELHRILGGSFVRAWESYTAAALPYAAIQHARTNQRAAAAREACADLLAEPDVLAAFEKELQAMGFAGDTGPAKVLFLAVISRLLPTPVSMAVKGPSSAGKSFLVKQVLRFFPEEAFYALTAMSDRALIYSSEPLEHRALVLYEADGLSEVAELIVRSLLSEGHVVYETVVEMAGVRIEREGPTALITTTTRIALHPENETRLLSMTIQDTPERLRAVLLAVAHDAGEVPRDLSPWHALQTFLSLSSVEVDIPYAVRLAELIPPVGIRLQRDFKALLTLIRAHALLHQQARERDPQARIVATLEDYTVVRELVHPIIAEGVEQHVPDSVRETVQAMISAGGDKTHADGDGLTVAQIAVKLGLERSSASRRLKRAEALGYVAPAVSERGGRSRKWVIGERLVGLGSPDDVLPAPDQLL